MSTVCGECGSENVKKETRLHKFPYDVGKDEVVISVHVPVYFCRSCGFAFLNYEAEEIIDKTISDYRKAIGK